MERLSAKGLGFSSNIKGAGWADIDGCAGPGYEITFSTSMGGAPNAVVNKFGELVLKGTTLKRDMPEP